MLKTAICTLAGLFALSAPSLATPELTTQSLAAGSYAQSVGIASFKVTRDDSIGNETLDSVELIGSQGEYLGQFLGGTIAHTAPYQGYLFTELDMVGMARFRTLAGGNLVLYFFDEEYVGEATVNGLSGDLEMTVDQGMALAQSAIVLHAAVLADEGLRLALTGGVNSQTVSVGVGLGGGAPAGGQAANDNDCPWYVTAGACATATACMFVAEIPPPCWGAIVVCVGCGLMELPPGVTPPPAPREGMNLCITYCAGTLVHTPSGEIPIEDLSVGDVVLSMDENLQPVLATVSKSISRVAHIGSSTTVGNDVIFATRGHRIMSARGWIPMEKASQSGVLCVDGTVQAVISDGVPTVGMNALAQTTVVHLELAGGKGYFVGESGLYAEAR